MASVNEIRESFLSFFERSGHARRASAPLVPQDDPTLLFVNAGMVPFKTVFTGAKAADAARVTSSQKCVRAGGKHNDLDNVGYTARHHTFFEMLGNFSFGDYFKEEAIVFAWDLVTRELGLNKDRLLVTYYAEDHEAAALWKNVAGLSPGQLIPIPTSDNFWSMGDTGPCGPCSEIFFDHGEHVQGGPPGSPDEDGDRYVEIWNLVFMQFDQDASGARVALPKPSIDTGMGLERIAAVLQGVHNNYDTDVFQTLIASAEDVYKRPAKGDDLASFRVIADHLRASAFLIADGVSPSNEGRGYVLRRIMRRAMRHGHGLGARAPSMFKLTQALVDEMGAAFPELGRAQAAIEADLEQEEARFQNTLGRGLGVLESEMADLPDGGRLDGTAAFKLYDTYGFPLDLTEDILRARKMDVDREGFNAAMARQKDGSRNAWAGSGASADGALWFDIRASAGASEFSGYTKVSDEGVLAAIVQDGAVCETAGTGPADLVFQRTPFYAESGGQAADRGEITWPGGAKFIVRDVQKRAGDVFVHSGELVEGTISTGSSAHLTVDPGRRAHIMSNHSATHLLHAALRERLGLHVTQKGSLVEADRLRFDFSHGAPVTSEQIDLIEKDVNEIIRQNGPVEIALSSPEAAIAAGALALFGEKYGQEVRVLTMGTKPSDPETAYSIELCGGTHVARTGDIGAFTVLSEQGVSAGIRRIEAATGARALAKLKDDGQVAADVSAMLKVPLKDVVTRLSGLVEERRKFEREIAELKRKVALSPGTGSPGPAQKDLAGVAFIGRVVEDVGAKDLRALVDEAKAGIGSGVCAFVGVTDGKAAVSVGVTADLTERISAVDLVRAASQALGGKGGGGRPDMAQAGGPRGDQADAALDAIGEAILRAGEA